MATLRCTVRGCGRPLAAGNGGLSCAGGHRFDRAREGYVSLLQPQDRRSRRPGDDGATVAARRRLLERGVAEPLVAALGRGLAARPSGRPLELLDVGAGDGFFLAALSAAGGVAAHAVDLSVAAVRRGARLLPSATWVVANADRALPWVDGAFDAVLSVHARWNPAEMRRVLAPDGLVAVAVPGPDDLGELRAAVLGPAPGRDRTERLVAGAQGALVPSGRESIRHTVELDRDGLEDALSATYRGRRAGRRERAAGPAPMAVTFSWELVWFRPAPRAAG